MLGSGLSGVTMIGGGRLQPNTPRRLRAASFSGQAFTHAWLAGVTAVSRIAHGPCQAQEPTKRVKPQSHAPHIRPASRSDGPDPLGKPLGWFHENATFKFSCSESRLKVDPSVAMPL